MRKMLKLRSYHFPVQYMCREWPFLDLKLKLRPPILIPRFETEQMIAMLCEDPRFLKRVE
jgi:methylase of polypeptide subunit release factors